MSIVDELVCFISRRHGFLVVVVVSLVDDNSDSFLSGFVVCRDMVFHWFSMESLILAQDERWRRA